MERDGAPRQRGLFAGMEISEDAYCDTVRRCELPATLERLLIWVIQAGDRVTVEGRGCFGLVVPSVRIVAERLGMSPSSVSRGLAGLEARGLIFRDREYEKRTRSVAIAANLAEICELADTTATRTTAVLRILILCLPRLPPGLSVAR